MLMKKYKDKKEELEDIKETLFDTDFVILRCLLKCAFDDDNNGQLSSGRGGVKDDKTRNLIISFLEANGKICLFIESLLSNLRDPNYYLTITAKEQPTEVLREDREDTWFICSYLKKLSSPYLKNIVGSVLVSIDKELKQAESLPQEKKYKIMIDMCAKFIKKLSENIKDLPKPFFTILGIIKTQYKSSSKDAIISIFFLRILYLALLTPDKFFQEKLDKPPTPIIKRKESTDLAFVRNTSAFIKIFKITVSGVISEDDTALQEHKQTLMDLHKSVGDFIEKISTTDKISKEKTNKGKKNKHVKDVMTAIKRYQEQIEEIIEDYTPFKITPMSPIGFFLSVISSKRSFSSFSLSHDLMPVENSFIEEAPTILGDLDDVNSPYLKIKTTLRSPRSYEQFKKFLQSECNVEPLELYSHILKYKKIEKTNEKQRIINLRTMYNNFIDTKGRYSLPIDNEFREKFAKVLEVDTELLESDDKLITELLDHIYFQLSDYHRRYLIDTLY